MGKERSTPLAEEGDVARESIVPPSREQATIPAADLSNENEPIRKVSERRSPSGMRAALSVEARERYARREERETLPAPADPELVTETALVDLAEKS